MALVLMAGEVDVANLERFRFTWVVELCAIGAGGSVWRAGELVDWLKLDVPTIVGGEIPLILACDRDGGTRGGHAPDRLVGIDIGVVGQGALRHLDGGVIVGADQPVFHYFNLVIV